VTQLVVMATIGMGMLLLGISSLRRKPDESISLAEAAILKAAGTEPLPLTAFDRIMNRVHAWLLTVIGFIIALIGLAAALT